MIFNKSFQKSKVLTKVSRKVKKCGNSKKEFKKWAAEG